MTDVRFQQDTIQQPVRVGLIGCGYWGTKLLRVFNSLETAQITVVCDQSPQQRAWVTEHYPNIRFVTDYRSILVSDCDAVVIATPAESHYKLAKEALGAGKHVFVEKPLALNRNHAEQLVMLAQSQDCQLFVGHIFEFDPAIKAIQSIIRAGALGEIYWVESIRSNLGLLRLDVNVIWDLLIHDVSVLHTVFDCLPSTVSTMGSSYITRGTQNICELCQVNMTLPGISRASAKASWLDPMKTRQLKIIGSQKSLVFEPTKNREIHLYDCGVDLTPLNDGVDIQYRRGGYDKVSYSEAEPLQIEARAFVDSILSAAPTNAAAAVDMISVLDAMQASLEQDGAWIQVNPTRVRRQPEPLPVTAIP